MREDREKKEKSSGVFWYPYAPSIGDQSDTEDRHGLDDDELAARLMSWMYEK